MTTTIWRGLLACFGPGGGDEEAMEQEALLRPGTAHRPDGAVAAHHDEPTVAVLEGPIADAGDDKPARLQPR